MSQLVILSTELTGELLQSGWRCRSAWDGIDFTPCVKDRYLSNWPLFLAAISAICLGLYKIIKLLSRHPHSQLTPKDLVSPSRDTDLARLEADVIISSLASSLLPAPLGKSAKPDVLLEKESVEVIQDFMVKPKWNNRLEKWRWITRVLGGALWLGVEVASATTTDRRDWRGVVYPTFNLLLSLYPGSPVTELLTGHLIVALLLFRSDLIAGHRAFLDIGPTIIELAYWSALISIPFSEEMDNLMSGSVSRGGSTSGSFGHKLKKHIEEPQSAFSRGAYTFMLPFLFKHYYQLITLEEIPALREDDASTVTLGAFRLFQARRDAKYARKHQGAKRKRNLPVELLIFFAPTIFAQCIWSFIYIILMYLPPKGLALLLRFVNQQGTPDAKPIHVAWFYIALMAAGECLYVAAMGQCLYLGRRLCIRLRSLVINEMFAKALRRQESAGHIKKAAQNKNGDPVAQDDEAASEGKINNLVAVDAIQVSEICAYIFYLASSPLAIVINAILLYDALGVASLAGILILLLLLPINALMGKLYAIINRRFKAAVDKRLEAVTEVIGHIKLIKFNAWESKFFDRMLGTRKVELHNLAQLFAAYSVNNLTIWGTPCFVTAAAFGVHTLWLKKPLVADQAFASLVLFNMFRDPLALFTDTFMRLIQAYTSCQRIQEFLDEPETLKYEQVSRPGPGDPQVGFTGAVVGYSSSEEIKDAEFEPFTLGEMNLSFPVGGLSVVIGPVGSGKTSLILSLLGETKLLQGKIFMPDDRANRYLCPIDPSTGLSDTIAYCAQTPWLVGATIKENIVFGAPLNDDRYQRVLDACALRPDLGIFEQGDQTEVGEKGTTCSGGQKARIALARALYSPAKTIILDDVLSAVDAQTARHIHNHCLQGPLIQGRTCIIVSHAVNLVAPSAAFIVMLDAGKVVAAGPPSDLVASGTLELREEETGSEQASSGKASGKDKDDDSDGDETSPGSSTLANESPQDTIEENLDGVDADALETQKKVQADKAAPDVVQLGKQLVESEKQETGAVALKTYMLYFKAQGGLIFWVILLSVFGLTQLLQIGTNAWVKDWANADERRTSIQDVFTQGHSPLWYYGVYCGIAMCFMLGVMFRVGINFVGSIRASSKLYSRLLKRILGAKMRFFDSTPSGRIMNRLSTDMSTVDQAAAEVMCYLAQCILSTAGVLGVVLFTTPKFIFALVGITAVYWVVGVLYITTSREIKRCDSVTRSPIYVSFSEALVGMSTIRSYGDSARFMRKLFEEVDQNMRCFWYLWQANRVLNNFTNFVGSFVVIFAGLFALQNKTLDAGAVGLSITYALSFTDVVIWVVRLYGASEMVMNSVERVSEYLNLEVEEEDHEKGQEPPAYWPSRDGSVVVEKLTCQYAPQLEPVLRGVSFTIEPKEKIGICGRTGSGKSTLALSFFRFLHQSGGSIIIDGIDIAKLSLESLRSRLTILPQEAQLFSGTIRDNLDPFEQHEDADVWDALKQVGLTGKTPFESRVGSRNASVVDLKAHATKVSDDLRTRALRKLQAEAMKPTPAVPDAAGEDDEEIEERVTVRSLDEKVAVGGKNFSQGQRQLLALARGLLKLRSSNFLIMDESTANLDHATDMTIQNVLRTSLADTQMLVIAHRLMTVCGLDRILVLDHGQVMEYGTPWELIQKEDGMFRDLCRQSGEEAQLYEMAKAVQEKKASL